MATSPKRRNRAWAPELFARLGRFAVRRRWAIVAFRAVGLVGRRRAIVAVWAIVLLGAIPLAPQVVGELRAGGFILDDLESARAKALLQAELETPPSAGGLLLHHETTT